MTDLSKHSGSLTFALEPFIATMGLLSIEEIKTRFIQILSSPDVKVSETTRLKWIVAINKCTNKNQQMRAITNAYLAGSGLGVNV